MSGYIRYRPSNGTYYLMTNSRRLSNTLRQNSKIFVNVTRNQDFFYLSKMNNGNILTPRDKELVTCISSKELLTRDEIIQLKNPGTKFSFPVKIKLDPSEFNVDKFDLYPDQDAAKLARCLNSKSMTIPERIMTPKAFEHDLEFYLEDKTVIIEITQAKPSENNYSQNFRHQAQGSSVRAHIFDIYRKCVNSFIFKKSRNIGFIILHENWTKYQHITKLTDELKTLNCHLLFTNFDKEWEESISNRILKTLKDDTTSI